MICKIIIYKLYVTLLKQNNMLKKNTLLAFMVITYKIINTIISVLDVYVRQCLYY